MQVEELNSFFKEYGQAYLKFEAEALVGFFHFPCLVHDLAGVHFVKNEKDLQEYERRFLENLQKFHLARVESRLLEQDFSLPHAAGVKVRYQLFNAGDQLIMDFDYSYSLVKREKWRILFARLGAVRKM